jgi:hypothetical protein
VNNKNWRSKKTRRKNRGLREEREKEERQGIGGEE